MTVNTRRKHIQICKQFFSAAIKYKLLSDNPFEHMSGTFQKNKQRQHFITSEQTVQLIEQAPRDGFADDYRSLSLLRQSPPQRAYPPEVGRYRLGQGHADCHEPQDGALS